MRVNVVLGLTIVCGMAAMLIACSHATDPANPSSNVQPTYSSIRDNVFHVSCATSSCHSVESMRGGMVLEGDTAYANLVGVLAVNDLAAQRGILRVNPGKPDSSFLIMKLTGPPPGEGLQMPDGNNPLDAKTIDAIRQWIAKGAPRD